MLHLLNHSVKRLKIILPLVFVLILVLISARFILFISFIESQKAEFRQTSISYPTEIKTLRFKAKELFKNKAGLRWQENNTEVILNGTYYEVKTIAIKNGVIEVSLSKDEQENESFDAYFNLNKKSNKLLFTLLQLFLNQTYLSGEKSYPLTTTIASRLINTDYCSVLSQGHAHELIKPPLGLLS